MSNMWNMHKTKIINTLIGIGIPAVFTLLWFAAVAYADDHYVAMEAFQQTLQEAQVERIEDKIEVYDEKMDLARQDALKTDDAKEKEFQAAREAYYKKKRDAQKEKLRALNEARSIRNS